MFLVILAGFEILPSLGPKSLERNPLQDSELHNNSCNVQLHHSHVSSLMWSLKVTYDHLILVPRLRIYGWRAKHECDEDSGLLGSDAVSLSDISKDCNIFELLETTHLTRHIPERMDHWKALTQHSLISQNRFFSSELWLCPKQWDWRSYLYMIWTPPFFLLLLSALKMQSFKIVEDAKILMYSSIFSLSC